MTFKEKKGKGGKESVVGGGMGRGRGGGEMVGGGTIEGGGGRPAAISPLEPVNVFTSQV